MYIFSLGKSRISKSRFSKILLLLLKILFQIGPEGSTGAKKAQKLPDEIKCIKFSIYDMRYIFFDKRSICISFVINSFKYKFLLNSLQKKNYIYKTLKYVQNYKRRGYAISRYILI